MLKWAGWLLFLVASFAAIEAWSLYENTTTLSRFVWTITYYFPPTPFIAGFLGGFLCCHFWWGGISAFKPVKENKMATQEQYTAADVAVQKHAEEMIATLPPFEQGLVREHLTNHILNGFAKVAVDAVVKE